MFDIIPSLLLQGSPLMRFFYLRSNYETFIKQIIGLMYIMSLYFIHV